MAQVTTPPRIATLLHVTHPVPCFPPLMRAGSDSAHWAALAIAPWTGMAYEARFIACRPEGKELLHTRWGVGLNVVGTARLSVERIVRLL